MYVSIYLSCSRSFQHTFNRLWAQCSDQLINYMDVSFCTYLFTGIKIYTYQYYIKQNPHRHDFYFNKIVAGVYVTRSSNSGDRMRFYLWKKFISFIGWCIEFLNLLNECSPYMAGF